MILLLLTIFVYHDMNELRKGFANNNNTFFLYEDENLYSALTIKPIITTNLSIDSFNYFTLEEIKKAEEELNKENYNALLNNNYRIFLIKPSVINKSYTLNLGVELNQEDLLEIIMNEDPFLLLAEKTKTAFTMRIEDIKKGFEDIYINEEKLKGYLFAALLANYFQTQQPGELIRNIKKKNIIVYPETISFKIIKYFLWM